MRGHVLAALAFVVGVATGSALERTLQEIIESQSKDTQR